MHWTLVNNCAELYKAAMAQMNISLPDRLKQWIEARVAEGRYSSASDYVRDLVRRDQDKTDSITALQSAIDAGRKSGVSGRTVREIVDQRFGTRES